MMKDAVAFVFIAILAAANAPTAGADEPDRLAVRGEAWQEALEARPYAFPERSAGMLASLRLFKGDCQVHMAYDPARSWSITFRFVRDGRELLSVEGHTGSVFRAERGILYFADFNPARSGCVVAAHDLVTHRKLWERPLRGVAAKTLVHSSYTNSVAMDLSNLHGTEGEGEGVILVVGRESYGEYVEVLDRKTGKSLAHRLYRQGFKQ